MAILGKSSSKSDSDDSGSSLTAIPGDTKAGWNGGRFTRAERNQAAFLGAIAGDCPCGQCELHRSISQAVSNPGTQF